jgi:hypothetical protein
MYFNYLVSMITIDARCKRGIKFRIAIRKAAFNKKKALFTSRFDIHLRKKPVKCCIWSTALYGAEIWTFQKVNQNDDFLWEMTIKC